MQGLLSELSFTSEKSPDYLLSYIASTKQTGISFSRAFSFLKFSQVENMTSKLKFNQELLSLLRKNTSDVDQQQRTIGIKILRKFKNFH